MNIIKAVWIFIQDEILCMHWLNNIVARLLNYLNIDISSSLRGSINFFIYDVIKITILLCILIFMISFIQSYFPPEKSRRILGKHVC